MTKEHPDDMRREDFERTTYQEEDHERAVEEQAIKKDINQCDGCRQGLPVSNLGNHYDEKTGQVVIGCTKGLYPKQDKPKTYELTTRTIHKVVGALVLALDGFKSAEDRVRARMVEKALTSLTDEIGRL